MRTLLISSYGDVKMWCRTDIEQEEEDKEEESKQKAQQ